MAKTTHDAYAAIQTALSTDLNSLANGGLSAASAAIDNSSDLEIFADFELVLAAQGGARSSDAWVGLYIVQSLDGTNYSDLSAVTARLAGVFVQDALSTASRVVCADVSIPPGLWKVFLRNVTGQAFAASGNTLKYRLHSLKTV